LIPEGPFFNAPGAFGYPFATWGARVKYKPVDGFYLMAGVYNGDPNVKDTNRHGVDFTLNGPAFVIGEMGLRWGSCSEAVDLPGNLKAGVYYNGGTFISFRSGTKKGLNGYYILGDQALLRWGDPQDNRHLGVFGSFTVAPDESISRMPYFFNAGLLASGVLKLRPKDFVGVGVVFGRQYHQAASASNVNVLGNETVWEFAYGYWLRPGCLLQPDIQYISNPGGNPAIKNALALGVNVKIVF